MKGIDYSWARPGGAAIKAAGFDFAFRYVPYPGDAGKGLTVAEAADLHANGVAIGLVFESTAGRALEGRAAGMADAVLCDRARDSLGFLDDRPFYFAVDIDAQPAQFAAIDDYLYGAAMTIGKGLVGAYGSYAVVEHCRQAGTAAWFWQTYAWSGGKRSDAAHLIQYLNGQTLNGGAVDYCESLADDFGQWPAPTAAPVAQPAKPVTEDTYGELFLELFEMAAGTRQSTFGTAEQARVDAAVAAIRSGTAKGIPEHEHDLAGVVTGGVVQ